MDCDGFVLSIETQNIGNDLKHLEDLIHFSILNGRHEVFSNRNKKFVDNFKIEFPEKNGTGGLVCLRSKAYSFKSGNKKTIKVKGISKSFSKNNKFDEYKNCLDEEEDQRECENYTIRSINHEMYLQLVQKSTISLFSENCFWKNNNRSEPWN